MSIPKIIHQFWMWHDPTIMDDQSGPDKYTNYMNEWKTIHPDFKYVFWNRRKVIELWNHPKLARWKPFFYNLARHIEMCDFSRYAILYIHGGWYCDLDYLCLKNISPLIQNREFGWTFEPLAHSDESDEGYARLSNSVLCSIPGHWIWPKLMDYIKEMYSPNNKVMLTTGPTRLSMFVRKYEIDTKYPQYFLNKCLVSPLNGGNQKVCSECDPDSMKHAYCYTRWNEGSKWWEQTDLNIK